MTLEAHRQELCSFVVLFLSWQYMIVQNVIILAAVESGSLVINI